MRAHDRASTRWPAPRLPRWRALATVLAVSLASLVSLALPGISAPASATPAKGPVRVLVVLDVSGSMHRSGGNGLTLLDGARNALAELVSSLPPSSEVGLRVYGSSYGGTDRRISCRDTRLLVPVKRLAPGRILGAARRLRPTGDTPIGLSLRYAAADLQTSLPAGGRPPGGPGVIVLISDGEDNCSPPASPPCQVVSGLKRQGYQVRVETVGVALAGHRAAKRALQCVASRTGGSYYDANGAAALSAALERISSDALGQLGRGRLVPGGRRLARAPLITPGTYRTRIRAGQRAWYRFKAAPGQRPRLLATVEGLAALRVPSAARNCPAWRAELYNPYGEGGSYPPYGNSGIFDGVGIGSTGASSTSRLDPYSKGIDFNGTWAMQLSLARDTATTCSEFLPPRLPFRARFSLQVGPRPATAASGPRPSAPVSATPSPSASPVSEGGVAASEKYTTPARPQQAPVWLMPVVAVGVVAAAGVAAAGVLILRRRRRRGW